MKKLPVIDRDALIEVTKNLVVVDSICRHFELNRSQLDRLYASHDLSHSAIIPPEDVKSFIRLSKIKKAAEEKGITLEVLKQTIEETRSLNKTMERFNLVSKDQLRNFLELYNIDFDKIAPAEKRIQIAKENREKTNLARHGVKVVSQAEFVRKKLRKPEKTKAIKIDKLPLTREEIISTLRQHKTVNASVQALNTTRILFEYRMKKHNIDIDEITTPAERKAAEMLRKQKTNLLRQGAKHNWCRNTPSRRKYEESMLLHTGYPNPFASPEIRERIGITKLKNGTIATSAGEKEILDFIRTFYDGEVLLNTRVVIKGHELDLYIPEFKLGIEYDGTYWHSLEQGKSRSYHFDKSKSCDEQGVRLIHIFELYWKDSFKRKIYEQIIRNAMNSSVIKLRASACNLQTINAKEAREFLQENHLGGFIGAKVYYGLYHDGKLVQVESFGRPRYDKNSDWESLRGCAKLGYMIYGGYEKVLKTFIEVNKPKEIISYVDFNIFRGSLHEKSGFEFVRYTGPDEWYLTTDGEFKRYWVVRGSKEKDIEWAKERDAKTLYHYAFAGSKVYKMRPEST